MRYQKNREKETHVKYLEQIGVELKEVFVTDLIRNNSQEFCRLILTSINAFQTRLVNNWKKNWINIVYLIMNICLTIRESKLPSYCTQKFYYTWSK
jgi:hypothetical protein